MKMCKECNRIVHDDVVICPDCSGKVFVKVIFQEEPCEL